MNMPLPNAKYISGEYLGNHPDWHLADSSWKADAVCSLLEDAELSPGAICEVGCGAGNVLATLRRKYAAAELFGYDISPDVKDFWKRYESAAIDFENGDFFTLNKRHYDVILLLDVIEHLPDPFAFLGNLRGQAEYYVFHIPLDLSAFAVIRKEALMRVRRRDGHVNYFTKDLAMALLDECGYEPISWRYSGAAFNSPQKTWKTVLLSPLRRLAYALNRDWGVRLLGGETLFILAHIPH